MIRSLVNDLDRTRFTMPPWAGTPEEAELLVAYLSSSAPTYPPAAAGGHASRRTPRRGGTS